MSNSGSMSKTYENEDSNLLLQSFGGASKLHTVIPVKAVKIGDFYPETLRKDFLMMGNSLRSMFEDEIKEYAPDWPDFKVGALIELMIERDELVRNNEGLLIPGA